MGESAREKIIKNEKLKLKMAKKVLPYVFTLMIFANSNHIWHNTVVNRTYCLSQKAWTLFDPTLHLQKTYSYFINYCAFPQLFFFFFRTNFFFSPEPNFSPTHGLSAPPVERATDLPG
jgi:hypothetical protein